MEIIPMRDLKNTVHIEELCETTKAPVFITKNGYGKLVVMNIECFEKLLSEAYETRILREGLDDLREGRVADGKAVLDELKQKYGL